MKKVMFIVLAALMVVANWTPQTIAQDGGAMSAQERDELIGQLKGALAKLEGERDILDSQIGDTDEVEGALSADVGNRMASNSAFSNMGSYQMGHGNSISSGGMSSGGMSSGGMSGGEFQAV